MSKMAVHVKALRAAGFGEFEQVAYTTDYYTYSTALTSKIKLAEDSKCKGNEKVAE